MAKQIIQTEKAPAPIGPYNQAVKAGNFLFVSGQIPVQPSNNEMIAGDVVVQARQVMQNIKAILEEAKLTLEHIVKATIFVTDMNFFGAVNEVYGSFFNSDFPARETVAVKQLPKGALVEISVIAVVDL
jgi:2-iminobutanoate/2-iminopropanoate deaminase